MNRLVLPSLRAGTALAVLALAACGGGDGPSGPQPPPGSGLNLRIDVAYVVQAAQNRDGRVPLVAGRDAYVRVFAVANQTNTATPAVRVRLYNGATLVQTLSIPAGSGSVPTASNQGSLTTSWNVKIPGSLIQPGLRMLADVDPDGTVSESNENDNAFPTSGTPLALDVNALAPLKIRFVPIFQRANGLLGRITEANKDQFMSMTRKIHPLPSYDADLRAPYTVEVLALDPQGNSWQSLVADLDAVRVAEGSDRYYYGVVQTEYPGGGVVGIAAGIPAGTALGWDRPDDAAETVAHELGHDLGRFHAPCGGAGGADPNYPYTLGLIGSYGMDVETGEVKLPSDNTDIMGYCDARFWISDYNYTGIYNFRLTHPSAVSAGAAQPALLVWGRIVNGQPVLEPAFDVVTRPSLPTAPGPYTLQGLDEAGRVVFSLSFAGNAATDVPGDNRSFAFAVPMAAGQAANVATLRISGHGRSATRQATAGGGALRASAAAAPAAALAPAGHDEVALRWNRATYPAVMVRDPRTGEILSLARSGDTRVRTSAGELELVLSDGVHSVARRVRAGQP